MKAINSLSNDEALAILFDWQFWARPSQLPPTGNWLTWLIMAGRGFGKTRAGAEFIRTEIENGRAKRIALVAKTPADARDVMIEGDSGILSISPPWAMPVYQPSTRSIEWANGAKALIFSSAEPDQLRGPQFDLAWGDEIRTWYSPQETWDNLMFGLRLGEHPRVVATTTPLPIGLIKSLLKSPDTVVTKGTTYENRANLADGFMRQVLTKYEGTRLGQQEIMAEMLEDVPGALWNRDLLNTTRRPSQPRPELSRIVIGVDPPGGATECGISVAGLGRDGHGYVLGDYSLQASPDKWAGIILSACEKHSVDMIVGEQNYGGDMVENTIMQAAKSRGISIRYKSVNATRGKAVRAEPIVACYEQNRVHHLGVFQSLEDELCTWVPGETKESPNRLDALVWALTEIMKVSSGYAFEV